MIEDGMVTVENTLRLAAISAVVGYLAGIGIGWILRKAREPRRTQRVMAPKHGFVSGDEVLLRVSGALRQFENDPPYHVRIVNQPYDWRQESKGVH
jgi:hypothetical protein